MPPWPRPKQNVNFEKNKKCQRQTLMRPSPDRLHETLSLASSRFPAPSFAGTHVPSWKAWNEPSLVLNGTTSPTMTLSCSHWLDSNLSMMPPIIMGFCQPHGPAIPLADCESKEKKKWWDGLVRLAIWMSMGITTAQSQNPTKKGRGCTYCFYNLKTRIREQPSRMFLGLVSLPPLIGRDRTVRVEFY